MAFMSWRDFILVMTVVLTWGAHPTIIKFGLQEMDPLLLNAMRYGLTALVFAPLMKKWDWPSVPLLLAIGVFFFSVNMGGAQLALDLISVNSFTFLIMLGIPLTIIVDWVLYKKPFGLYTVTGMILAFLGVFVIYGAPDIKAAPMGFFYCCVAIVGWITGSFLMRRAEHIDFGFFCFCTGIGGCLTTTVMSWRMESEHMAQILQANWFVLSAVLAYQVLILGVVTYFWRGLMARNPAELVTPFLLLQVPLSIGIAAFFLGETLAPASWLGGGLIVSGVALIQLRRVWKFYRGAA